MAEIEQIVGALKAPPKATDPSSGEITCTYQSAKGPSFIELVKAIARKAIARL